MSISEKIVNDLAKSYAKSGDSLQIVGAPGRIQKADKIVVASLVKN